MHVPSIYTCTRTRDHWKPELNRSGLLSAAEHGEQYLSGFPFLGPTPPARQMKGDKMRQAQKDIRRAGHHEPD